MQMAAFTCLPSDPIHPHPKHSSNIIEWFQNEDKNMVPLCIWAMISMSTRSSTCLPEHLLKCQILSSL